MDPLCESALWNSELTWNTTNPYFTSCFEEIILRPLPSFFLVTFGVIDVLNASRSKNKTKGFLYCSNALTTIKTLLTAALIALNLAEICLVVMNVYNGLEEIYITDYLSPTLQSMGFFIVLVLSLLKQHHMVSSSGVQFFFWLLTTTSQLILFRTALKKIHLENVEGKLDIVYVARLIVFPLALIQFILEFVNNKYDKDTKNSKSGDGKPNPEKTSTFISKLLFLWYDSLAWTGYKRTLERGDIWNLNSEDTSRTQFDQFSKHWSKNKAKKRETLNGVENLTGIIAPLFKCYGLTYGIGVLLKLASDMLAFVQPEILSLLIAHVSSKESVAWKGYFYVAILCIATITQTILNASSTRRAFLVGMHIRTAISNAVYRKALVISQSAKRESSVGEIINLQSVDSNKLMDFLVILVQTFGGPIQILISIVFLYQTLGPSTFAGVAILFALIPLNAYLVSLVKKLEVEQMKLKDKRIKLTSEVINGIKVLKFYAWEPAFQEQIGAIREKEIICLKKIAKFHIFSLFIARCAPIFVSVFTFLTYVLLDPSNVLTAEKTFVSINLFNIMRRPMIMLPVAISSGMQAAVSTKRLTKFLNMEELDWNAVTHALTYSAPITIENGNLSWNTDRMTLRNINFSVGKGELVAVVGMIGSGKSSLLSALLGDLTKHSGIVNIWGNIAYVSQTAWIQNATIRDNILFQDNFVQEKYATTITSCALGQDLQILPAGDHTEIGEKGINLSGGQKQRVALARAAYKDAEIFLLDDPLSAVDAHVGKHIFDNLIGPNGTLKNKTRVLVTHGISFLPEVDRIIVMKDGEISEVGTYEELLLKQGEFAEFLQTHLGIESDQTVDEAKFSTMDDTLGTTPSHKKSTNGIAKMESQDVAFKDPGIENRKLIQDEVSAIGNVNIRVFLNYCKSAGIIMSVLAFGFAGISNALFAISNIWLADWTTQTQLDQDLTGSPQQSTTDKYLIGYGLIGLAAGVTTLLNTATMAVVSIASSRKLHSSALSSVLRSPMSYFDTTPAGRLLNRFSKDVDTLDNVVPMNLRAFTFMLYNVLFSIIVISYATPIFIAFIIPMAIAYFLLQRFYVATSRQLKRMEGVTRSPIFSHFGETISGSSIIRAFHVEDNFIRESEKRVDTNQMTNFPFLYSNIWMAIRLEFIGMLIILFACILVLLADAIEPGDAGLAISSALQITNFLNLMARQMSELEANIVSVERIMELTRVPQEPAWENNQKPSEHWPDKGELILENYMTRYRDGLDLVLKGVSCTIQSREKIGIVGRTGAGKSSLTLALFRIMEGNGGKIFIDGIDISKLGLHDLRTKITIIPQEPVLFSGTLRVNIDPFNNYSDEQVWNCLKLAHLKPYVATLTRGLQHEVETEGQNFSVGQRQLICLARALLRKTKILVLDEATAAVDLETDKLIQATIRKEFFDSTVITIAHRLNTILDSHRVLVLDRGEVREFDSPKTLLENQSSLFYGMARDAKLVQ